MTRSALAVFAACLAGCDNEQLEWVTFNADNQTLTIDVLPEGEPEGEARSLDLLSNLGITPVGVATVDPGSGPVGTSHLLVVDVIDDFEENVGRVTVEVSSEAVSDLDGDGDDDSRGEVEYELRQDSADPSVFAISLQSQGAAKERREDVFTVRLWTPDDLATTTLPTTTTTEEATP